MARNKLIAPMKRKGTKQAVVVASRTQGRGARPASHFHGQGRSLGNLGQEVELEIDGITIVVGRNPATGRFRVVLERLTMPRVLNSHTASADEVNAGVYIGSARVSGGTHLLSALETTRATKPSAGSRNTCAPTRA